MLLLSLNYLTYLSSVLTLHLPNTLEMFSTASMKTFHAVKTQNLCQAWCTSFEFGSRSIEEYVIFIFNFPFPGDNVFFG